MVVCLLGAGASTEAGPPTSSGMASDFWVWAFQGAAPPAPGAASSGAHRPSSSGELLSLIWSHLLLAHGRTPTIEEVALACSTVHPDSAKRWIASPLLRLPDVFIGIAPRHVEEIELDLIRRLKTVWLPVQPDRVDYLRPVIDLASIYPDETLKLFTLNYDLSIEVLCESLGVPYTDGFSDGGLSLNSVPVFSDVGRDRFAEAPVSELVWKPARPDVDAKPRVEVFKLHGSANWFQLVRDVAPCTDQYELYGSARSALQGDPFGSESPPGPLAKITRASNHPLFVNLGGRRRDEVYLSRIMFGTAVKFMPAVPFIRMYELLYRYLRRTSVCVVVGYSFRDAHVNSLLRDAFNRDGSRWTRQLNLVIVDACPPSDLVEHLRLRSDERVWQIVGRASDALRHPTFRKVIDDLTTNGRSDVPRRCVV